MPVWLPGGQEDGGEPYHQRRDRDGLAATFDTRLNGVPAFTGRASRPMARLLKRHGRRLVAAPASFLIGSQNTLLDGEAARARRWGMTLGAVSKTYLPAPA